MATFIATATNVVKPTVDYNRCQPWQTAPVSTLAERMRWILDQRGWKQREISKLAGLSHSYVSAFFDRAEKDPKASMRGTELAAIAKAANVSLQWLTTGEGEPALEVEEPAPASVEALEGTAWERIPGWGESVAAIEQRFPTIPSKLLRQIGQTRGSWVQVPMTWEWLIVQANHALKAMPDKDRLRLMDEQREALLERELAKDHAAPEPPKLEVVPSLPGIEPSTAPAKKSAKR